MESVLVRAVHVCVGTSNREEELQFIYIHAYIHTQHTYIHTYSYIRINTHIARVCGHLEQG